MKKGCRLTIRILIAVGLFFLIDNVVNALMMTGVNHYYGLDQDAEILLIGHSHLMLATDKSRIERETGMKVSKYCREGVNVTDKKAMVQHFLNSGHADSLKYVLYGVDLATFTGTGLSQNSYMLFYPFIDDTYIDKYIKEQASGTDYWLHKLVKSTRFNDDGLKNSAIRGWFDNWDNFKNNTIDINLYKRRLANGDERHIQMTPELMRQFDETIGMITDRGIRVILVNTPTIDLLNQFEPEKYKQMMDWFTNYALADSLVEFWDYNPKYESEYTIFSDRLHLNNKGQQLITDELVKGIKSLKK